MRISRAASAFSGDLRREDDMHSKEQNAAHINSGSDAPIDKWPRVRHKIRKLIFEGNDYIIYTDKNEGDIHWETSHKYDKLMAPKEDKYDQSRSNKIINQSDLLQAILS